MSGNITTDLSRQGITSTTSIMTAHTTNQTTCTAFRQASTCLGTVGSVNQTSNTSNQYALSQQLGTAAQSAALGMQSMAQGLGTAASQPSSLADTAAVKRWIGPLVAESSAQTNARQPHDGQVESMTKIERAQYAGQSFEQVDSGNSTPVLGSVEVSLAPERCGKADVYNLTVGGCHEYFANGVLVSNCDALRYGAMSRPMARYEDPKKREIDLWEEKMLARQMQKGSESARNNWTGY